MIVTSTGFDTTSKGATLRMNVLSDLSCRTPPPAH